MRFLLISILFLATSFHSAIGLIDPEEIQITITQARGNKESYQLILSALNDQIHQLRLNDSGNKDSYQLDILTEHNQKIPLNLKDLDKSIRSTGFKRNSIGDNSILSDIEQEIYDYTMLHMSSQTPFVQSSALIYVIVYYYFVQ